MCGGPRWTPRDWRSVRPLLTPGNWGGKRPERAVVFDLFQVAVVW